VQVYQQIHQMMTRDIHGRLCMGLVDINIDVFRIVKDGVQGSVVGDNNPALLILSLVLDSLWNFPYNE